MAKKDSIEIRILTANDAGACWKIRMEQIMLAVGTTRDAAVKLYRSLGFESYGCERRALKIGDRYIDEEYMVLFVERQSP